MTVTCKYLGVIDYRHAWNMQEELRAKCFAGELENWLLLLEHPPVMTLGRRACAEDFVSSQDAIAAEGIDVIQSNRGGRITYHGPGQLVGYFICSLTTLHMGVAEFVRAVEEICLRTLADFGIRGERDCEHPGIWVGREKIAAVGLHFSRGVSQHGFALNIAPNLDHFRHIIPCGIKDRGVTSMERLLGDAPPLGRVRERVATHLPDVFKIRDAYDDSPEVKTRLDSCGVSSFCGSDSKVTSM